MIPSSGIELDYPRVEEIYARFSRLAALGTGPGGLLLLYKNLDSAGLATVMAANVAGIVSLGIESDAAVVRKAMRAGVCDFVVNSLDEALRILKNEVRQLRTVSVVLTEEVNAAVTEIVARGVQPDVLAFALSPLIERGAKLLSIDAGEAADGMLAVTWEVQREPARWLLKLDRLAAEAVAGKGGDRDARVKWLEASPRYLSRNYAGQRYLRMKSDESDRFLAAVQASVDAGEIQVAVQVRCDGAAHFFES
jgi:hypothetical protein